MRLSVPSLIVVAMLATAWARHGSLAAGEPGDGLDLGSLVPAAIEVYNELGDDPLPFLSRKQVDALLAGEVVRIRERAPERNGERPERAVGYALIRRPRLHVWLAALDPQFQASDLLTEVRLEPDATGASVWYQHLSLPWPITDRHWVIRLWQEVELCRRTQGLIWEQRWDLAESGPALAKKAVAAGRATGLTLADVADAIYLPHNQGGWTLFSLDEEITLLAYRVSTVVGGSIPESWIATFAMAQLTGLLRNVDRHAETAWRSYDPDVVVIRDGAGDPIAIVTP